MAASIYDWSVTAANNASADGSVNWAEGQAPSTVNGSARQMMARVAEIRNDIGGVLTVGGSGDTITITANSAFSAYANGLRLAFKAGSSNTGAATLNVNGIGAKPIRKIGATGDSALAAGDLQSGSLYEVVYATSLNAAAGGWQLLSPLPVPASRTDYVPTGAVLPYVGISAPTDFLMCYGQAVFRCLHVRDSNGNRPIQLHCLQPRLSRPRPSLSRARRP